MKVKLPNGEKKDLDETYNYQKKEFTVINLLNEWDSYINENWNNGKVKHFVGVLATYLINHKEQHNKFKNNKYILSPYKMRKMKSFKSRTVPFSSLDDDEQIMVGHKEYKEEDNYTS